MWWKLISVMTKIAVKAVMFVILMAMIKMAKNGHETGKEGKGGVHLCIVISLH